MESQILEGFLERKEESSLRSAWVKSFCRVCGTKLFYSDQRQVFIGYIDLSKLVRVEYGKPMELILTEHSGKKVIFRADQEARYAFWIATVSTIAKHLKKSQLPDISIINNLPVVVSTC
eukprot:TRINITY_DN5293_c0_g1_i1.p1 TRINITY_DN5293_c0_g1~~TRINITY_DN5293_c0_g1_i1.p1  ORF type:complete len:119 (+),score=15.55 TRINITY_DN5293_c0_g1_i1:281-637(+)